VNIFENYPQSDIEALDFRAMKNFNQINFEKRIINAMESPMPDASELKLVIQLLITEQSFLIKQLQTYDIMIDPVLNRINDNKKNLRVDDIHQILMAFHERINSDVIHQRNMKEII
jgi:hypothetical protein